MSKPSYIPINLFLRTEGHHMGGWRHPHPSVQPHRVFDIDYAVDQAKIAERGRLDSIFFADGPGIGAHQWNHTMNPGEPITYLSAIAMVTKHIGLIGTMSTTYSEPYNLARQMAWLDHLSKGRAGWNVVTTSSLESAYNFGYTEPPSHSERYERAAEFVQVVMDLWDSWEEDALVADKSTGLFVDESKLHRINHEGKHFRVRGPLNVQRPPQGYPFMVQAGSSGDGMNFAASFADAIFTSQHTIPEGQAFYKQIRGLISDNGRDPDTVKILPGLSPILGSTVEEAKRLQDDMHLLNKPEIPLKLISNFLGIELSNYDLDEPFPLADTPDPSTRQGHQSRAELMVDVVKRGNMTIRDLVKWHEGGRGHRVFVGTPEQMADDIELWVKERAADGFNLMPSVPFNGLGIFVDHVIPILQKRGLFRTEYEDGQLLRNLYGLPRVENRFLARKATEAS